MKVFNKIKLTVIIAARNEGEEVTNTLDSLFATIDKSVEVILINDHSDTDKFPEPEPRPGLEVIHNKLPDYGLFDAIRVATDIMKADKFFFCNCRSRFTPGWAEVFIKALNRNEQTIFTPISKTLSYDQLDMDKANSLYGAKCVKYNEDRDLKFFQTQAITDKKESPVTWLGGMGVNKKWWLKLGGLKPLMTRGAMNSFTSLKCWKAGGEVKVLDVEIGNIYREYTSYPVTESDQIYNYAALAYILFDQNVSMEVFEGLKHKKGNEMAKFAFANKFGELIVEKKRMKELHKRNITNLITQT